LIGKNPFSIPRAIVTFFENCQVKTSTKVRGLNLNEHFVKNILELNTYRDNMLLVLYTNCRTMM